MKQKQPRSEGSLEMRRVLIVLAAAATAAGVIPIPSPAQQPPAPPYKVTPLVSAPLTADPSKETVVVRVDWPANVSTPWHTHPGDEYATVLEGSLITQREGEEAKTVLGGQSYHHPAGVVHVAKTGDQPATTINVFVVEKGKPFLAPVKKQGPNGTQSDAWNAARHSTPSRVDPVPAAGLFGGQGQHELSRQLSAYPWAARPMQAARQFSPWSRQPKRTSPLSWL